MGQGASQPDRRADGSSRTSRRTALFRRSQASSSDEGQQDGLLSGRHSEGSAPRLRTRPGSVHRLSQLFNFDNGSAPVGAAETETARRPEMLQRSRSTFREILGRRESTRNRTRPISRPVPRLVQRRASYVRNGMNRSGDDYYSAPRLPSIDLTHPFDNNSFPSEEQPPPQSSSSRRSNLRLAFPRPDIPFRHFNPLRRRRPSPDIRRISSVDDQAAMLSRLLSVAAAATAATLMGDDQHALTEARSLSGSTGAGDIGGGGEDGSFDGFLRALQNGRIASALRNVADPESENSGGQPPLNFFRMFRFGTSAQGNNDASSGQGSELTLDETNNEEGRMVPIIIVGIRSISPGPSGSGTGSPAEDLPPFIDALGSFPSPLPAHALGTNAHDSIDSILRPPQNGTSFRHRRRASLGGFGMSRSRLSDRMDDQRDQRSPDRRRERPWSVASSSSMLEPRPPPATPASPSPELSRISSRNNTPGHSRPGSIVGSSLRDAALGGENSRRNSTLHRASSGSPLEAHTEETVSLHSTSSGTNLLSSENEPFHFPTHRRSDTAPNMHYPRFSSGHSRRNGMVEPLQNLPSLSRSSTTNSSSENSRAGDRRSSSNDSRSWIIYVLGGSYPENHPILTTPSLFTDNPTYEDMMLLSALLGPVKAPVATEEDVEHAGGLYTIVLTDAVDEKAAATLVAQANDDSSDVVTIDPGQRCLVCLCEFEMQEIARRLAKCAHLYHKECIDQWLTQGRNSCPLCRGQGVDEKDKAATAAAESEDVEVGVGGAVDQVEIRQSEGVA